MNSVLRGLLERKSPSLIEHLGLTIAENRSKGDRWTDGWRDEGTEGRRDGRMDGWIDREINGLFKITTSSYKLNYLCYVHN